MNARTNLLRAHATSLLSKLTALDAERFFTDPVDPVAVPEYAAVIAKPVCFRTMQDVRYRAEQAALAA
jgi:hypothetical protein